MSLVERLNADLKASMLARDEARTSSLRMIRAEILKKEKERVGTVVTDEMAMALLQTMAKQRRDSIEQFNTAGRADLSAKEESELAIILTYLPPVLEESEVRAMIQQAITAGGVTSGKDLGKMMGPLMKALKDTGKTFDGKRVNEIAKEMIGG